MAFLNPLRSRSLVLLTALILAAAQVALFALPALADPDPVPSQLERERNWYDLSPLERRAIEADMRLITTPPVEPIGTDEQTLYPFSYRRLLSDGDVPVYDAPNGQQIDTVPLGFNFVSIVSQEGDWTQINYGEWVSSEYISAARISQFTGVLFTEPLRYPMAWLVLATEPSPRPGAAPLPEAVEIERYTPVTIFAKQRVGDWDWYLIGPDQWINQRRFGRVLPIAPPEGVSGHWIGVDLYEQVLIAYEDETPVFATLIASGLPDWSTDEGLYQIDAGHRFASTPMIGALGEPDSYIIEDIPWTMYFNMDSEEALHGAYWHDGFGYRRSHGCVNMTITDSKWLYDWTAANNAEDAWVYVYHSREYQTGYSR